MNAELHVNLGGEATIRVKTKDRHGLFVKLMAISYRSVSF